MVITYNPIEVRYASGELSQGNFVREFDYECAINERDYWHHMYNQATAPVVDDVSKEIPE